ncbi:MAG: DUF4349 domain-containing protein [Pyrinomonadaceae bacterium]
MEEETVAQPTIERKIIRNAELTVETETPDEGYRKIIAIADSRGGYVVSSEATQREGSTNSSLVVKMVVRVPASGFDAAIEEVRKTGSRVRRTVRRGTQCWIIDTVNMSSERDSWAI